MRYFTQFVNQVTGEKREVVTSLDSAEIAAIEEARSAHGDELARVVASATVLKSAYSELNALEWDHSGPPTLVN
ncbi:hypothetical protein [Bradyrhizobium sp. STM 3557]|uniref:hypothetical protein n=1 Tax=Bradyrhizobium sp. STM 3557 TaxID=578920 RepID=UPI00388E8949